MKNNFGLKSRRRVRNIYVPKSGQLYYATIFSFLGLLFFAATVIVLGVNFISPEANPCLNEGPNYCQVTVFNTLVSVTPNLAKNIFFVVLIGITNIVVYFLMGLLITHRTFGPLIAFNRHVDALLNKDYSSRITLRKNDQFSTLATKLNLLAEKMKED